MKYQDPCFFCAANYKLIVLAVLSVVVANNGLAQAQDTVVSDGTLGTTVNNSAGIYTISGGTIVNNENQFHSFSQFDLLSGNVADFTGPIGIQNIVSRVTGGLSTINGTIQSSIIGADLWIINPNGVMFGSGSVLDISGSFHVSTADYLLLEGGGQFFADSAIGIGDPLLFVGDPMTFGFLSSQSARIQFQDTELEVLPGESMSFVAFEVALDNTTLRAPSGRLNLASVGAVPVGTVGEISLLSDGLAVSGINYSGGERVSMSNESTLDVSGEGGGSIYIRGGQFLMGGDEADNENISADTLGGSLGSPGGVIDIEVAGDVILQGEMSADTSGSGNGADISIVTDGNITFFQGDGGIAGDTGVHANSLGAESGDAGSIYIQASTLNLGNSDGISVETLGSGNAGDIEINVTGTGTFFLDGEFRTSTSGSGAGGNITIRANKIKSNLEGLSISSSTTGVGSGGDILLEAAESIDLDHGTLSSSADSTGNGGSITLRAPTITLDGGNSNAPPVSISSETSRSGNAGDIFLESDALVIRDGAAVTASTNYMGVPGGVSGDAGSISISAIGAFGTFDLTDGRVSSVSASSNSGAAGSIDVTTDVITVGLDGRMSVSSASDRVLNDVGAITLNATNVNVFDNGLITGDTSGAATGSNVNINADFLTVTDTGSISVATSGDGDGGIVTINATSVVVDGGGRISGLNTGSGVGGNVTINADDVRIATNGSENAGVLVTAEGSGTGGVATINATSLVVEGGGRISGVTTGSGLGGNVTINADDVRIATDGSEHAGVLVTASGSGAGGRVDIKAASLVVEGDGVISGDTSGTGIGGTIEMTVGELLIHENGSISVSTTGAGQGGDIDISGDSLEVRGGGSIAATTAMLDGVGGSITITSSDVSISDGGQISANTEGDGAGGSIVLNPDNLFMESGGTVSVNAMSDGDAGSIIINVDETIFMDESFIESESTNSSGGAVVVNAGDLIYMTDSEITTNAQGSVGNAGTIQIGQESSPDSPTILIIQGNTITAIIDGVSSGTDGAIDINGEYILGAENTILGNVNFDVPATDFVSVIAQLDIPFLNVAELLGDKCAVSVIRDRSSFIVEADGLKQAPDNYAPSSFYLPAPEYTNATAQHIQPGSKLSKSVVLLTEGC